MQLVYCNIFKAKYTKTVLLGDEIKVIKVSQYVPFWSTTPINAKNSEVLHCLIEVPPAPLFDAKLNVS